MKTIHEAAREVPVAAEVDLCVVGGSCTGVFAAVRAARLGLKVALVEAQGILGGVATASLVIVWHSLLDTEFRRPIIGGLTSEIIGRLRRRNAVVEPDTPNPSVGYSFNPDELVTELDVLLAEAGVRPFLHARFADVARDGDRVAAAIIEDKSGRRAIRAKVFVDATGDGDLVARAGLPFELRPDLQPPTTCFWVRGLSGLRACNPDVDWVKWIFDPSHGEGGLPHGFLWARDVLGLDGVVMVAGTRVPGADCSDADQLTRAEVEGRRQARVIMDRLRKLPGGDELSLVRLPAQIGIRETRHPRTLRQLTEAEVLEGVCFDDAIANGSYRVDVHHSDKPGLTFRYLDGTEHYVVPGRPTVKGRWRAEKAENPTFYQVPYRSLIPRGATNVLAAGRLMDSDRGAYGAVRVMVNCNQTGEAAGVAAVLAIRDDVPVGGVDASQLRAALAEGGSVIL